MDGNGDGNDDGSKIVIRKRKMVRRRFNPYSSTDSELDYADDVFSDKLVSVI